VKYLKTARRVITSLLFLINPSGDLYFIIARPFSRIDVSMGSMSGSALNAEILTRAKDKVVLEFGSGGSTLALAQQAKILTSIQSDHKFARAVQGLLDEAKYSHRAKVIWANIGMTKTFGQPILWLRPLFQHRYANYVRVFYADENSKFAPELVFIDGRFRVYCVLSILSNYSNSMTLIVDDFFSRPEYAILGKLLGEPASRIGDAAIFQIEASDDRSALVNSYSEYQKDFR